ICQLGAGECQPWSQRGDGCYDTQCPPGNYAWTGCFYCDSTGALVESTWNGYGPGCDQTPAPLSEPPPDGTHLCTWDEVCGTPLNTPSAGVGADAGCAGAAGDAGDGGDGGVPPPPRRTPEDPILAGVAPRLG